MKKGGFGLKILVDGFNGTVDIIWVEDQRMTNARLRGGRPCDVILLSLRRIAVRETKIADLPSDKLSYTGHTIAEICENSGESPA